ncbi:unnamed protein product [Blepharisma stoltei]|uniref:START domain-containing protein n=1 Tax=Blepharisma stoltei TaxID=1481888 RepID=A0AAU9JAS4_9CILI|nr:unnamed protein product [Blepharisma stoltei]
MGSQVSNLCLKCFDPSRDNIEYENIPTSNDSTVVELLDIKSHEEPLRPETQHNNLSVLEKPQENTNILHVAIEEAKKEFLAYANSPMSHDDCEELHNKDGYTIYGKDLERGFILKSQWKIPYTPSEYLGLFLNLDERVKWDPHIQEIKLISKDNDGYAMTHTKLKKHPVVSQRDIVSESKLFHLDDGMLIVSKSCEHPDYPATKDMVRMILFLTGYYVQPIEEDEEGNKSKVFNVIKIDFGGSFPQKMVKKANVLEVQKMNKAILKVLKNKA